MAKIIAWAMFILGIGHIVFGIVRFHGPLADAVSAGFIGQFIEPEVRRTAFWFLLCGPLIMLMGHLAIRAVAADDRAMLKIGGAYGFITSAIGVAAFPVSPLWAPLVLSLLLLAVGYRWIK
ncbi:MAG: hypothetical protein HYS18_02310 [Burkholderiales bacterium]|nr:hypothetical protein [Burkholderiales bacterium]